MEYIKVFTLVFLLLLLYIVDIKGQFCTIDNDCQPDAPVQCKIHYCNMMTNMCEINNTASGSSCDDSTICTITDQCDGNGNCAGIYDGFSCNDGFSCTIDTCVVGVGCVNTPDNSVCGPTNTCSQILCIGAGGDGAGCDMFPTLLTGGEPCDDGNPNGCLGPDSCDGTGTCVAGAPILGACDDSNICTTDSCEVDGNCTNTPLTGPAIFPGGCDGISCTSPDMCVSGSCVPGPPIDSLCGAPNPPCQLGGICNLTLGGCQAPQFAPDLTPCEDTLFCTSGDVCVSGTCQAGTPIANICDDSNECTDDICFELGPPSNFTCFNTPTGSADPCDDGNPLTGTDVCIPFTGMCQGMLLPVSVCGGLILDLSLYSNPLTPNITIDELDFTNSGFSLREAFIVANELGGNIIINLASNTYDVTGAPNEDFSCTGDLDYYSDSLLSLTIQGISALTTKISAFAAFPTIQNRIMDIPNLNLTTGKILILNDLAIERGNLGSSLFVPNVTTNNINMYGGGLRSVGTDMNITRCAFNSNNLEFFIINNIIPSTALYGGAIGIDSRNLSTTTFITDTNFNGNDADAEPNGVNELTKSNAIGLHAFVNSNLIIDTCVFDSGNFLIAVTNNANLVVTNTAFNNALPSISNLELAGAINGILYEDSSANVPLFQRINITVSGSVFTQSSGVHAGEDNIFMLTTVDGLVSTNINGCTFSDSNIRVIFSRFSSVMLIESSNFLSNDGATTFLSSGTGLLALGNTNVTIDNCLFSGGTSLRSGSAIGSVCQTSGLTQNIIIENSVITAGITGSIPNSGGAIYISSTNGCEIDFQLKTSTVSDNTCTFFSCSMQTMGILAESDASSTLTLLIEDSIIKDHTTGQSGAPTIEVRGITDLTILRSTINNNIQTAFTGPFDRYGTIVIDSLTKKTLISRSTISNNVAGAIEFMIPTIPNPNVFNHTLTQNTISGNTGAIGSAIYVGNSIVHRIIMIANTITNNQFTQTDGSAIKTFSASTLFILHNNIIANNFGGIITGSVDMIVLAPFSQITSFGYNLIRDQTSVSPALIGTDLPAGIDPSIGVLQNNGGTTETHLPSNVSPVINAGDDSLGLVFNNLDQRFTGFPRLLGCEMDIGSIEASLVCGFIIPTAVLSSTVSPILVTTTSDVVNFGDGLTSLREAVLLSNEIGGSFTIILQSGTYLLTIGGIEEDLSCVGDLDFYSTCLTSLTIQGAGVGLTIIDGNSLDRIFDVVVIDKLLTINDATIQNGFLTTVGTPLKIHGGAVRTIGSDLTVQNCTFQNNAISTTIICTTVDCAAYGGAIGMDNSLSTSNLIIKNSLFQFNTINTGINQRSRGGAIGVESILHSDITIEDSQFTSNIAELDGGAIDVIYKSNVSISNCQFTSNQAITENGGAICFGITELIAPIIEINAIISSSTFITNIAEDGGAISSGLIDETIFNFMNGSTSLIINSCNFQSNTVSDDGGSIFNGFSNTMEINNSNFTTNIASNSGGCIYSESSRELTITSCIFYQNTANDLSLETGGGVLYSIFNDKVSILSSIFTNNLATENGGCILFYSDDTDINRELIISDSTFTNNTAGFESGVLHARSNGNNGFFSYSISNSIFTGNSANEISGALSFANFGAANGSIVLSSGSITNCTFKFNNGGEEGGAVLYNRFDNTNGGKTENIITNSLFEDNTAEVGGALLVGIQTRLNVTNTIFRRNIATVVSSDAGGGAMRMRRNARVLFEDCIFEDNRAEEDGGAFDVTSVPTFGTQAAFLTIVGCTFDNNTSVTESGGAIHAVTPSTSQGEIEITIENSNFTNNIANSGGGAIYAFGNGRSVTMNISKSNFIQNTALGATGGGSIWFQGDNFFTSTLNIEDTNILSNSATDLSGDGGGIRCRSNVDVNLFRTTIAQNTADRGGAIYYAYQPSSTMNLYLEQCTVSMNNATTNGAAFFYLDDSNSFTTLVSTTIAFNGATGSKRTITYEKGTSGTITSHSTIISENGNDIEFIGSSSVTFTSLGYNLIQDNGDIFAGLIGTDQPPGQNALLGPLQNNGGCTLTHLPSTLSPAFNNGDSSLNSTLIFDQRGTGFPRLVSNDVDIGSVEADACSSNADCDDSNPCTVDICEVDFSCSNTPGNNGTTCRASAGFCDIEEVCDGINAACPVDTLKANTEICRNATGDCDVEELCDGITATCPSDLVSSNTTVCRPSTDICDPEETCDGVTKICPSDLLSPDASICGSSNGCLQAPLCLSGVCQAPFSNNTLCDDSFGCTIDTCNSTNGLCVNTKDDSFCQTGLECSMDSCNPMSIMANTTTGCVNIASNMLCENGTFCDGVMYCNTTTFMCETNTSFPVSPPSCDDAISCTVDTCNETTDICINTPNNGLCNDSISCTDDTCSGIADCLFTPNNANCDDSNECTQDTCSATLDCIFNPVPLNGMSCSDNDVCTTNDTCSGGSCIPGIPLDCDDSNPCTVDTCDPVLGCQNTPGNSGTICRASAGICDIEEVCDGINATCPLPDVKEPITTICRNTTGECDLTTFCDGINDTCPPEQFEPSTTVCRVAVGDCDVEELCDGITENCPSDSVSPNTLICRNSTDENVCDPEETCDGITKICPSDFVLPDGNTCDDANECTTNDTCQSGICIGGVPPNCDDSNVCTIDTCNVTIGCVNTPGNNGTICRSSTGVCDIEELCDGINATCPLDIVEPNTEICRISTDGNMCDPEELCDGITKDCPIDLLTANGTTCDDGDACTTLDTCQSGVCVGGPPLDCDDSNPCTSDSCNSLTGCVNTNEPDGTICGSGIGCTDNPLCLSGVCQAPVANNTNCDDLFECTIDVCNATNGLCSNAPDDSFCQTGLECSMDSCMPMSMLANTTTGCVNIASNMLCENGTFCDGVMFCNTTTFMCETNTTLPVFPPNCDDSVSCTIDTCNETSDICINTPNDGLCDDSIMCTDDTCSSISDCIFTPNNANCDDSNECTQDTCSATLDCVFNPTPLNGNSCSDGNMCTTNDTCSGGTCVPGIPLDCDDSNPCTVDTCNTLTGCVNTPGNLGTICRASVGVCDIEETCDGVSPSCPLPDAKEPITTVCRPSAGICDIQETCDGIGNDCPIDLFLPSSSVCRASAGICDIEETCSGSTADCPLDVVESNATLCRASTDQCDPEENCDGINTDCPTDAFLLNGTPCDDGNACTTNDTCISGVCTSGIPPNCDDSNPCTVDMCNIAIGCINVPGNLGVVCRASAGVCDITETCDGINSACPLPDAKEPITTMCFTATGDCDLDTFCDGINDSCPATQFESNTTVCRIKTGDCDIEELCDGTTANCPTDLVEPNTEICRISTDGNMCDPEELCDGVTKNCPTDLFTSNGTPCDDGDACTTADTCQSGICVGGAPPNCDDSNPCTADSCNSLTGCVNTNEPDGITCGTSNGCIQAPLCLSGICQTPFSNNTLCDDSFDCTIDTCNSTNGLCVNTKDDSFCQTGLECSMDSCNPMSMMANTTTGCVNIASNMLCENGTFCDGVMFCNITTFMCETNTTLPVFPPNCDDSVFCTVDTCNETSDQCINTPNNGLCDDSITCTDDTCSSVADCLFTPNNANCDDSNECTQDTCSATLDCVFNPTPLNGMSCSDNDVCTTNDTCSGGTCIPGIPLDCDDSNPCTIDTCDSVLGCQNTPGNAGTVCRASVGVCDIEEVCDGVNAMCPLPDAKEPVTTVCRPTTGDCDLTTFCDGINNACPPEQFEPNTTVCRSSGGICDVEEFCDGTTENCPTDAVLPNTIICRPSTDGNICDPEELCDGVNKLCPSDTLNANGTPCDDGDACTTSDTCQSGICVGGVPPNCDDSNVCTIDTCNILTGCVNTPGNNGTICRATNGVCDTEELCDGISAMCPLDIFEPITTVCRASAGICDIEETCTGSTADCPIDIFEPITTVCRVVAGICDLEETCTGTMANCPSDLVQNSTICRASTEIDCDPQELCDGVNTDCPTDLFSPNNTPCTDGNACTTNDTCSNGLCIPGSALDCNDNNPCTIDTCNMMTGCVNTNEPDGTACGSSNGCIEAPLCLSGTCQLPFSNDTNCIDAYSCTDDICNSTNGLCINSENNAFCDTGLECAMDSCMPMSMMADPITGCVSVPNSLLCENGTFCDGVEFCNTTTFMCQFNETLPVFPPNCDDGVMCTIDSCNETTDQCINIATNSLCDDSITCTDDTCSPISDCIFMPNNANCDDSNECTQDTCSATLDCVFNPIPLNGMSCSDNDVCTTNDTCSGGTCIPGIPLDCDDSNPCTVDTCDSVLGCQNTPGNSGALCRPSVGICDIEEVCDGINAACPLPDVKEPITTICRNTSGDCDLTTFCDGINNDCPAEQFQPNTVICRNATGVCDAIEFCDGITENCPIDAVLPNTELCRNSTDANICDLDEFCDGINKECPSDIFSSNGTTCDDGDACTTFDSCINGICIGGPPLNCDDSNPCTIDSCDSFSGCVNIAGNNGTLCRPVMGDCDVEEFCDGVSILCPSNTFKSNSTLCRNSSGVCDIEEFCTGITPNCPLDLVEPSTTICRISTDGNICDPEELCDGVNKNCTNDLLAPNGVPCDDGNECTTNDTCQSGICVGGPPPDCNDSNPCTVDTCDTITGCVNTPGNSGSVCRPSVDVCDSDEVCDGINSACPVDQFLPVGTICRNSSGICDIQEVCNGMSTMCPIDMVHTSTTICMPSTDGNMCDPEELCDGVNKTCPPDSFETDGTTCTDLDECTFNDTCVNGVCISGPPLDCDDSNPCTTDSCDSISGCINTNLPDGTLCGISNGCIDAPVCFSGICQPEFSNDTNCIDSYSCTVDTCNSTDGSCINAFNDTFCQTGLECSMDSCMPMSIMANPTTGCVNIANSIFCENGTFCDGVEFCNVTTYMCQLNTTLPVFPPNCDDGVSCTVDTCNETDDLCVNTPNDSLCNDNITCTDDSCSGVSDCIFMPNNANCDDGNPCTQDSCSPTLDCIFNPIPLNGVSCDDGNACTTNDVCQAGVCVGGSPPDCNDSNPCTVDTCNNSTGCVNTPGNSGSICRPAVGICDIDEVCDGINAACPLPDAKEPSTTVCRPSIDQCDAEELCDGINDNCPADLSEANGTPCDDNNTCTSIDECHIGICVGVAQLDCNDGNICTVDTCDTLTGCINDAPSADGYLCDDGQPCTIPDLCLSGICTPGIIDICDECTIKAGSDAFRLGDRNVDFSTNPIPSGFFGPGSDPFNGVIVFEGNTLDFVPSSSSLPIDSIVERKQNLNLLEPGGSDTIPVELIALSLKSVSPFTPTFSTIPGTTSWNIECHFSQTLSQPINATLDCIASNCSCTEGGTFILNMGLTALQCQFSNVTMPTTTLTFDGVLHEFVQNTTPMFWYPDDTGFDILSLPTGVVVDPFGTEGTTSNVTMLPASGDYFPGLRLDKCTGDCEEECQIDTDCDDGLICTTDLCIASSISGKLHCVNNYNTTIIGQSCYTGPLSTQNVGQCSDGINVCQEPSGNIICSGQVLPAINDTSGDGLDSDCNGFD